MTDKASLGVQVLAARPGGEAPGVLVVSVYPRSPAEAMGIRAGDEVLDLGGVQPATPQALVRELGWQEIGATVRMRLLREGKTLEVQGPLGSYQRTQQAYHEECRRRGLGQPVRHRSEIVWQAVPPGTVPPGNGGPPGPPGTVPPGKGGPEGLGVLKGKLGVVVSFHNCTECLQQKFLKIRDMRSLLQRSPDRPGSQGWGEWVAFVALYNDIQTPHEKNLEDLKGILARNPVDFPVGLVRYPEGRPPLGSLCDEPLFQDHGTAIVDPDGKLIFLEIGNPGAEFHQAFMKAMEKYRPGGAPAPAKGAPAGSKGS